MSAQVSEGGENGYVDSPKIQGLQELSFQVPTPRNHTEDVGTDMHTKDVGTDMHDLVQDEPLDFEVDFEADFEHQKLVLELNKVIALDLNKVIELDKVIRKKPEKELVQTCGIRKALVLFWNQLRESRRSIRSRVNEEHRTNLAKQSQSVRLCCA